MYNFDISAISDLCNSFRPHNPQLIREIPIKYTKSYFEESINRFIRKFKMAGKLLEV